MRILRARYYSDSDIDRLIKPTLEFLKLSVIAVSDAEKFKSLKNVVAYFYEKARAKFKCYKEYEGYSREHDSVIITRQNLIYFIAILVLDILCRKNVKVKDEEQKKRLISDAHNILIDLLDDAGVTRLSEKDQDIKKTINSLELNFGRVLEEIVEV